MLNQILTIANTSMASALICATLVLIHSVLNFSRTGPQIKEEINKHYRVYTIYAIARLYLSSVLLCFVLALPGVLLASLYLKVFFSSPLIGLEIMAGLACIGLLSCRQFLHCLFYNPGIIVTSINFSPTRLNSIYKILSGTLLRILDVSVLAFYIGSYGYLVVKLIILQTPQENTALIVMPVIYVLVASAIIRKREPDSRLSNHSVPTHTQAKHPQPNIVILGSDTLRADHMGAYGYKRDTTPFIDSLAKNSSVFKKCYVPLARTAPSLLSLFTGCWPSRHKITTNYISDSTAKNMKMASLGAILKKHSYQTSAISDWSGADLGKFDLGFDRKDLPKDQWNLKYLIRQGPKSLRLLLSIFCQNKIGKAILPEIYYLAGIPLTKQLGRETRNEITTLARNEDPFFLNVFMGTTHPPFSSNHPYFSLFTAPDYEGKSKFCMSRLTTPEEIIESQQEPKEAFDLNQVIDLYDGSIRQFDDEVRKIVTHLKTLNLIDNTILLIYSDHGIDFFEKETWGQGNSISSNASAHIPLIIHSPNIPQPKTIENKVRSIDIMPTLLDLCGIQIDCAIDGHSLEPMMRGSETRDNLPVIFETGLWLAPPPKQRKDHITYPDIFHLIDIPDKKSGTLALKADHAEIIENARDWFIWQGKWMLKCHKMKNGPQYELFNTSDDPDCKNNIMHLHTNIVRDLVNIKADTQK